MTADQFRELCRGTARQLGCADADALFLRDDVLVDGVKVGVLHREEDDPFAVVCFIDLGELGPRANTHEVLTRLMALNLALDGGLGEVIGLEPESGHLVLRARLDTERADLHEGRLAEHLRGYAALANELHETVLIGVERPI